MRPYTKILDRISGIHNIFPGIISILFLFFVLACEKEITKPIISQFSIDKTSAQPGDTITFTNLSENALSYEWQFGDGNKSTNPSPLHYYVNADTFTISLIAFGENANDTSSKILIVSSDLAANFTINKSTLIIGEKLSITNNSLNYDSCTWDFGDGKTSMDENVTHSFSEEGTYTITLSVVDKFSTSTYEDEVKVISSNQWWKSLYNSNNEFIDSAYYSNALLITEDGSIYFQKKEIADYYTSNTTIFSEIDSIYSIYSTSINSSINYEIGAFTTTDKKMFKHLIIWKKVDNIFFRELEFISEFDGTPECSLEVDTARNLWVELCNKHIVADLVSNLYHDNAIYYNNNKPVVVGVDAITEKYAYMAKPDYSLFLDALHSESVTNNLVFEIGQCSGSWGGKYVIVWKYENAVWKILLDSNY